MNYKLQSIIRLAVALILMLNGFLTAKGLNPIPFDESTFTEVVTYLVGGLYAIRVWWKNNDMTEEMHTATLLGRQDKKLKNQAIEESEADYE